MEASRRARRSAPRQRDDAGTLTPDGGTPAPDDAGTPVSDAGADGNPVTNEAGVKPRMIAQGFTNPLGLVALGDTFYVGDQNGISKVSTDGTRGTIVGEQGIRYLALDSGNANLFFTAPNGVNVVPLEAALPVQTT